MSSPNAANGYISVTIRLNLPAVILSVEPRWNVIAGKVPTIESIMGT